MDSLVPLCDWAVKYAIFFIKNMAHYLTMEPMRPDQVPGATHLVRPDGLVLLRELLLYSCIVTRQVERRKPAENAHIVHQQDASVFELFQVLHMTLCICIIICILYLSDYLICICSSAGHTPKAYRCPVMHTTHLHMCM